MSPLRRLRTALRRARLRGMCLLTGHPGGQVINGRYACYRCSTHADLLTGKAPPC